MEDNREATLIVYLLLLFLGLGFWATSSSTRLLLCSEITPDKLGVGWGIWWPGLILDPSPVSSDSG